MAHFDWESAVPKAKESAQCRKRKIEIERIAFVRKKKSAKSENPAKHDFALQLLLSLEMNLEIDKDFRTLEKFEEVRKGTICRPA